MNFGIKYDADDIQPDLPSHKFKLRYLSLFSGFTSQADEEEKVDTFPLQVGRIQEKAGEVKFLSEKLKSFPDADLTRCHLWHHEDLTISDKE